MGFKCTYIDIVFFCVEIYERNKNELVAMDDKWITVTKAKEDPYIINKKILLPQFLETILTKGPIAEKQPLKMNTLPIKLCSIVDV